MNKEQVTGLFALANIEVLRLWKLPNNYWPESEHYAEIRSRNPWWLVKTKQGLIEIGWRKNVISIDWSDTDIRHVVTTDDVTKSETMVHAWSEGKAIEYLKALNSNNYVDKIIINGKETVVPAGKLTYEEVVKLATGSPAGTKNYTVTYSYRDRRYSHFVDGSLCNGQSVETSQGAIFNVIMTGNA